VRAAIFTVRVAGHGKLSTMARPRGGDWLRDEMSALREAGVDILVSMLSHAEVEELGLIEEATAASAAGIEFVSLPTPDRGLPDTRAFRSLVDQLVAVMGAGNHVVIHCRMGIGRSSMVAAAVLMARGTNAPDAWAAVASARGLDVPDTAQQRQWVERSMRPS
jgi:protein-tyrosine phosphatase